MQVQQDIGKKIIAVGIFLLVIGLVYYFAGDKFKWLGHLPGDIRTNVNGIDVFVPITTMVLLSVMFNLAMRLFRYLQ